MDYIAHIDENGKIQTVLEHSTNTARMAADFAVPEMKKTCAAIGLMHDIGKYLPEFQRKIRGGQGRVEHSICGAKEIPNDMGHQSAMATLMQLCIAGHHSGIPDMGTQYDEEDCTTLCGRLKRTVGDYSAYGNDIKPAMPDAKSFERYIAKGCKTQEDLSERLAFFVRYCFSCLTDADSLDTEIACGGAPRSEMQSDFAACEALLNARLKQFACKTNLQRARSGLQEQAYKNINAQSEISLMRMPTGSGKTLAGMRCALKLARECGLHRLIYVIPYNSIIDQTVEVFEKLFGDKAQILRHQSSFSYDDSDNVSEDYRDRAKQASENWDAQIIITTAVQFFESLYADKRGKLRKLHNMANSVIIFDEAHMMPVDYLQPCLRSVFYVTHFLNSRAIFLTATMPDYTKLIQTYVSPYAAVRELITDRSSFPAFDKCRYQYLGKISSDALAAKAAAAPSALIVVNTKKKARELYNMLGGRKYYLSTYMTGYDRVRVISEIRTALDELCRDYPDMNSVPEERRITVVSTSLIEAGVDLDFYEAYRELAGLDNILQTGGRCNREGKREFGNVYVFEREESSAPIKPEASLARGIFDEFESVSSEAAIDAYYERLLYVNKGRIVSRTMKTLFQNERWDMIKIRSYAQEFNLIDSANTETVAVCRDDASEAMRKGLEFTGKISLSRLQPYCCTVSRSEFEDLKKQGVLEDYGSGVYFLTNLSYYNECTGIKFEGTDIYI